MHVSVRPGTSSIHTCVMLNLKPFFVRRPSCASQPLLPYCRILRSWPPKKPILLLALFLAPDMATRSEWTTFFLVFFLFLSYFQGWVGVFVFRSFSFLALNFFSFFLLLCESARIMLAGRSTQHGLSESCHNCCAVGLHPFKYLLRLCLDR